MEGEGQRKGIYCKTRRLKSRSEVQNQQSKQLWMSTKLSMGKYLSQSSSGAGVFINVSISLRLDI